MPVVEEVAVTAHAARTERRRRNDQGMAVSAAAYDEVCSCGESRSARARMARSHMRRINALPG